MSIKRTINNFRKKIKRTLFTTPSHAQGAFIVPESEKMLGKAVFECDFSEIDGFDNMACPSGPILEMYQKAASIYGAKNSFYLINGSTSGILALMYASLKHNDKVLLSRNCHKAVYNGLVLTGAYPIWINSDYNEDWGIFKPVSAADVETAISQNTNIKVLIITNPTYEGLISEIEKISAICKKYNIILIVDEAHGALWNFEPILGTPSLLYDADAVVQSLHKTAGALNPAAILHLSKNTKISAEKIQEALNLFNTTSPSYPILLNIETTIDFLSSNKGKKHISELISNINKFKKDVLYCDSVRIFSYNNDITKLLIQIEGMSGYELGQYLNDDFNIEVEIANQKSVLCLCGIGTTKEKLNILKRALLKISRRMAGACEYVGTPYANIVSQIALTPLKAYHMPSIEAGLQRAVGCISKELVVSYPPGIPLIVPGEIIQKQHIAFLEKERNVIKIIA